MFVHKGQLVRYRPTILQFLKPIASRHELAFSQNKRCRQLPLLIVKRSLIVICREVKSYFKEICLVPFCCFIIFFVYKRFKKEGGRAERRLRTRQSNPHVCRHCGPVFFYYFITNQRDRAPVRTLISGPWLVAKMKHYTSWRGRQIDFLGGLNDQA